MPQHWTKHPCKNGRKELNLSAMRSWLAWDRAPRLFFSLSLFLQLLLGVALARACMREAGCRGVNGALRNLQARARAGRHLLRPCTFPRPHGMASHSVRVSCCLALYSLIRVISPAPFLFSPSMAAAASWCISMGAWWYMRCDAGSRHGSRPAVSHQCWRHDRQIPRDACLDMFSVCFRAGDLNAERPLQFCHSRG